MERTWNTISIRSIRILIIYFVILLITGLVLSTLALLSDELSPIKDLTILAVSWIGGIGMAFIGSSIFYLRKLYKSCLGKEITEPKMQGDKFKELGIVTYFALRPAFALCFSILINIALQASVAIITAKGTLLDKGFIHLNMIMTFLGGFAAGDLIEYFESKSAGIVKGLFKDNQ